VDRIKQTLNPKKKKKKKKKKEAIIKMLLITNFTTLKPFYVLNYGSFNLLTIFLQ
jgi:hypothetical protein